MENEREVLLEVNHLNVTYGSGKKAYEAVQDANFKIYKGETFGLVGESGSGKSVILKLLSLFRWIYKKNILRDIAKNASIKKELYRFRIDKMLRESGLSDFCLKGSQAHYYIGDFYISIIYNDKLILKISPQNTNNKTLEKISFITDDRFAIPMLANNQIRRGAIPYHLEKTFDDFWESFNHLQTNKKVKVSIFDLELSLEKYGIENRLYINLKNSKTQAALLRGSRADTTTTI